jgi:hypothetical protein
MLLIHEKFSVMLRTRSSRVACLVLAVCAACVLAEAGLRVNHAYPPPDDAPQSGEPDIFESDPAVGYRLRPSRNMALYSRKNQHFDLVVSNADGFRSNRELDVDDGRRRILIVGDSFVFGLGVRVEDRMTEQLEATASTWRVDNLGMPGWGMDLMIRAIEQYGGKARPHIVVLAIYSGDFQRLLPYFAGVGYRFSKFDLVGGELVTVPFPHVTFWEHSRIVQLLYRTLQNIDPERLELNEAILERYLKIAHTIGFTPVVMFHPTKRNDEPDQKRRAFLQQWTSRNNVSFLDLTAAIQSAGVTNVYITNDIHWNPAGHRLAAAQLRNFLHGLTAGDNSQ